MHSLQRESSLLIYRGNSWSWSLSWKCVTLAQGDLLALKSQKSAENQSCPRAIEKLKYLIFEFGENWIGRSGPLMILVLSDLLVHPSWGKAFDIIWEAAQYFQLPLYIYEDDKDVMMIKNMMMLKEIGLQWLTCYDDDGNKIFVKDDRSWMIVQTSKVPRDR